MKNNELTNIYRTDNEALPPTKCKCHKGFRGLRGSEVLFNFSCNLIRESPAIPYALTLDRYRQP
jgi:hypothetical protein